MFAPLAHGSHDRSQRRSTACLPHRAPVALALTGAATLVPGVSQLPMLLVERASVILGH